MIFSTPQITLTPVPKQEDEISINPRSRSARLRAATRTGASAFPLEDVLFKAPAGDASGVRT